VTVNVTRKVDNCEAFYAIAYAVIVTFYTEYESLTELPGCPPGRNSISSEGNFLEAINMSLNVFERHYVDRNLDRTGQIVLCITPGTPLSLNLNFYSWCLLFVSENNFNIAITFVQVV